LFALHEAFMPAWCRSCAVSLNAPFTADAPYKLLEKIDMPCRARQKVRGESPSAGLLGGGQPETRRQDLAESRVAIPAPMISGSRTEIFSRTGAKIAQPR